MLPGVYQAVKKDGTIYYRSNITYCGKHISLGSFRKETEAHEAYCDAEHIINGRLLFQNYLNSILNQKRNSIRKLSFEKCVTLFNYRDNHIYIGNPIYLRKNYFSYFLSPTEEMKFDIDDLFYYTRHKIQRRKGHLFVNDYGMQLTITSRFGLKPYAVEGRDFRFVNGDSTDYRYSNIEIINRYHGVSAYEKKGITRFRVKIHINGNYTVGTYSTEEKAAIAYNKAVDMARKAGITRNYMENYVDTLTAGEYADYYNRIKISKKYLDYLEQFTYNKR